MDDSKVQPTTDIKLMTGLTQLLWLLIAVLLVGCAVRWSIHRPVFTLQHLRVEGQVSHNTAPTLRAHVGAYVQGNFFTTDLARIRTAFEAVPWVRRAVVRREFPNRLKVQVEEHQVAASWGNENEAQFVNTFGEVFEADPGDVEIEQLPRLSGPVDQAKPILQMYYAVQPFIAKLDLAVASLELSSRGNWRVKLDSGARIEMGRGSSTEVTQRLAQFIATMPQVAHTYGRQTARDLETADLRHSNGYAVRLRGITTATSSVRS